MARRSGEPRARVSLACAVRASRHAVHAARRVVLAARVSRRWRDGVRSAVAMSSKTPRGLVALLGAALLLRLAIIVMLPSQLWLAGGDGPWYIRQAWLTGHSALVDPMR